MKRDRSADPAPTQRVWPTAWATASNDGLDAEMENWAMAPSLLPPSRGTMTGTSPIPTAVSLDASDVRNDGRVAPGPASLVKPNNQPLQRHQQQQQKTQKSRSRSSPKKKAKRRPRHRTEAENDLFTSFTLNRDPQNSKYLPYDEVVYPKLFNRPKEARRRPLPLPKTSPIPGVGPRRIGKVAAALEAITKRTVGDDHEEDKAALAMVAAAELDNMWVVGFVEDARRNQKDLLLRDLRDFVRLPGSTVLPGSHAALATIDLMGKPTSFNASPSNSKASVTSADRDNGSDDAGITESAHGTERGAKPAAGKNALTDLESLRLRELERRLSQQASGVKDADVLRHAGVKAYSAANRKLRKILGGARPPAMGPSIKSEGLEAVFRRNRGERAAATRIQRLYKHYYRRKLFRKMILQLQGVVKIQALARGVIARRFVAEWYARRSIMVLAWQNIIRRMLSNIRWKRRLALEQRAASRIQAAERGRAGRLKARRARINLAALRIQCLWRGSVDRVRVDRLWLGTLATRIQGLARMMVAKRVVGRTRRICNGAARSIQRSFRGTVARKVMLRLIWARSMASRLDFLRVLAAEEEWERENMEITQRRSRRMMLEERLEDAVKAEAAAHAVVFELESNEQELKTQRMMLSPRALEQGWKEELDSNIGQHKDWITMRKLEAVFDAGLPARELEEEVKRRDGLFSERRRRAARLARWRDTEMKEIFDREARKRFDDQHLQNRRKVADEKRRWAVNYVTLSGKPDKLKARRRTRPWEATQDPIEKALKQVPTEGGVDLFAYDRTPEEALEQVRRARRASKQSGGGGGGGDGKAKDDDDGLSKSGTLEQVVARLQLQSHINQVAQFEEIMRPAEGIVSSLGIQPLLAKDRDRRDAAAVAAAKTAAATTAENDAASSSAAISLAPGQPLESGDTATPAGQDGFGEGEAHGEGQDAGGGEGRPSSASSCSSSAASPPKRWPHRGRAEATAAAATARAAAARSRPAAAGFSNRYGAAASTPPGPPPVAGTGGTPVPIEWGEEARIKARQRQRRLHMLAQEGRESAAPATGARGGRGGEGAGAKDSRSTSRVPWLLLDELDAEKQKLMLCKVVWR
eukprot:g4847.t1